MSDKKQIYKPKPVSGFPEWLPEERLVEQKWLDHIRRVFESYGFTSIETPAVEELDVLTAKGETDKEIYTLTRLQADEHESKEARLGLHFDQTVPFARYTAQHFNELTFPFKRYQMQKVWRGERPQLGRMREFLQCDIDVINVDHLPLSFDAEIPAIIYEVLSGLDIGRVQLRINNRKFLTGFLHVFCKNKEKIPDLIRLIDKIEKISNAEFKEELVNNFDFNSTLLANFFAFFSRPQFTLAEFDDLKSTLQSSFRDFDLMAEGGQLIQIGLQELSFVLEQLKHLPSGSVVADLSIVRGLDYYTGTVYETRLLDIPEFTSSVCSGGRYDDLAGSYINKHLPGVGISIGFTRLFDVLRHHGYIKTGAKTTTDILVVLPSEEQRALAAETARTLRKNGYNVELYHAPQKIGKQFTYAEKKGIPYVWLPPFDAGGSHEVKDMSNGTQIAAEPATWTK